MPSIFASLSVIAETIFEVLLPFLMMKIVDVGIASQDLSYVVRVGLLMVAASLCSLFFGIMGARLAAVASTGFAKNVRGRLFHAIQDFSFANIDRFSTASLIDVYKRQSLGSRNCFYLGRLAFWANYAE